MLGWHVSVFRQRDGGALPALATSPRGSRLALWQADVDGFRWLDELIKEGRAIDLGGQGYPMRLTAPANVLIPRIVGNPPRSRGTWVYGAADVVTEEWAGRTMIDHSLIAACLPTEWLLVEAWDES